MEKSAIKQEISLEFENTIVKEELVIDHQSVKEELEEDADIDSSSEPTEEDVKSEITVNEGKLNRKVKDESLVDQKDDLVDCSFSCDLCDFKTIEQEDMRNHYTHDHTFGTLRRSVSRNNKKYKCSECSYRSHIPAHVRRHMMIHTGETPYGCSKCSFKTRDTSTLKRHMRTQHSEKKEETKVNPNSGHLSCSQCDYTTRDQRWLTRHRLSFHEKAKSRYECPHCQFKCMQKYTFMNHVLLHNDIASHPCRLCEYKTNIPSELHKHLMRKHVDSKPFECSECNYKTKSRSDLSKHSVVHKTARPYSCSLCDYKCKRSSHLRIHQSVHCKKYPHIRIQHYTCPFCKYKTINISSLKIHVRRHTGEKPFNCDQCERSFPSKSGLNSHKISHIVDWSQTCPHCEFTTNKPLAFKVHIKSHNGQSKTPRNKKIISSDSDEDTDSAFE